MTTHNTCTQLDLPKFRDTSMTRAFWEFHGDNPHVLRELLKLARQIKERGYAHYSINTLFEVVRWHRNLEMTDVEFKLNNNYRAYYARMIMAADTDLNELFRLRSSEADTVKI